MTSTDISFVLRLTGMEGWNYTKADILRLMRMDPRGSLKAVVDGKRVGITTTTSYQEVGWIGNVIVLPGHRGKQVGTQLMYAAIQYLERCGCRTIRLNSYLHTTLFYESFGFKGEYHNIRYYGRPSLMDAKFEDEVMPMDIRLIERFDRRYFGASRGKLLDHLLVEYPTTFIAFGGQELHGYLVGQTSGESCEIAPWVVDDAIKGIARKMWRALSGRLDVKSVAFTAPQPSRRASDVANWLGLKGTLKTLRMYMGSTANRGKPEGVISLGGLEKG